jgi:hypothetical protein
MYYGIYENGEVIAKFVTPLTVKSNQPVTFSDTLSLKRQISRRAVQRWEITTNLEPLSDTANTLFVNLVTKGFSETVQIVMPQNVGAKKQLKAPANNITVSGSANATQLTTLNMVSGEVIPAGTFIKFSNHSKIYILTSNLTGSNVLNIFPSLRVSLPNGTTFTYKDDVIMNCLYDTDVVRGMVFTDGIVMDMGTVTLVEKL